MKKDMKGMKCEKRAAIRITKNMQVTTNAMK